MILKIDASTHSGYLGGIERTQDSTASYWCTSSTEVIFHDVTKFPVDSNDPKQLKKVHFLQFCLFLSNNKYNF
ncbi:hypothetical protein HK098_006866 [Nowakowskiella sp. JEL0407]|nr:hypothetical protein HK098_006866 [Nowakowskiella sp. JEL0407]